MIVLKIQRISVCTSEADNSCPTRAEVHYRRTEISLTLKLLSLSLKVKPSDTESQSSYPAGIDPGDQVENWWGRDATEPLSHK